MSQIYNNGNRKSCKKFSLGSEGSQLGNLRILLEIQQRVLGPGESTA